MCKNLANILQEKDHFPNKYARFLQDSCKSWFARNLQSLARHFLLGGLKFNTSVMYVAIHVAAYIANTKDHTTQLHVLGAINCTCSLHKGLIHY